jgi:beta-lactamase class A
VVAHDADREVWSASLYKLFVARALLDQIADGVIDRDATAGDSQGRTWAECLRDMIVVSDDDCGVAGIDHVGRGALDPALAAAGYPGTHLDNPQRTPAADVDRFLTATYDGTLLGPGREDASGELFGYLAYQQVNDRLAPGLPPGTGFAHKTGDRTGWAHDAGVIASPVGDLLVVALSGPYLPPCCHAEAPGPAEAAAFAAFADLASRLWAEFDGAVNGG